MVQGPKSRASADFDLVKLSSPRIFVVRMMVFLVLCALVLIVLYKQIKVAFFANPGLNALIGAVLLIGIILAFRQVLRLYPEIAWVNHFRLSDPGLAPERRPRLLAPMAAILGGERSGVVSVSQQTMRHLLDSIATRLDEARDISRYMTGLLVFLGLLGTFWGLIETVGSVGQVIDSLKVGGDAGSLFDSLKEGLAAPLGGMGISFSSSLFGLAGSLILGFLDLQSSQAQNRFYTDLEDWLAGVVRKYGPRHEATSEQALAAVAGGNKDLQEVLERLRGTLESIAEHPQAAAVSDVARSNTTAMANLAEAIQELVQHMRTEQQLIREWADGQGEQSREIKRLLEQIMASDKQLAASSGPVAGVP
ncbi:MAG TPA: flagellar motor protein MotA [Xanthobacteraceae bacterium]|nr:flagellar motor protein MotA [Xanthobacteraceae bacterium]